MKHVSQIAKDFIDELSDPAERLPSGVYTFDKVEGGFLYGDVHVIAGVTGATKSTLVDTMAMNIAKYYKKLESPNSVAIFTLEMSDTLVFSRQFSSASLIPFSKFKLTDYDYLFSKEDTIRKVTSEMSKLPLYISDSGCFDLESLAKIVEEGNRKYGIKTIVVDYLQLMSSVQRGGAGRTQEVSYVARSIKELAQELDLCVILVSQYSRAAARAEFIEDRLTGGKESSQIEQDAAFFADISITSYTTLKRKYPELEMLQIPPYNPAILSTLKYRHGGTGDYALCFIPEFYKYTNAIFTPPTEVIEPPRCPNHKKLSLIKTGEGLTCPECDYMIPRHCGKCTRGLVIYTVEGKNGFDYEFVAACPNCQEGVELIESAKNFNTIIKDEKDRIKILGRKQWT